MFSRLITNPAMQAVWTAGLVLALITLAIFQYMWIGEVSEANRQRLQQDLRRAGNQISVQFQNELENLTRPFRFQGPLDDAAFAARFGPAYLELMASSGGSMVKAAFLITRHRPDQLPELLKYDPFSDRFQTALTESEAAALRTLLDRVQGFRRGPSGPDFPPSEFPLIGIPTFSPVPAGSAAEAPGQRGPGERGFAFGGGPPGRMRLIALQLERDVLLHNVIHELIQLHLNPQGEDLFNAVIVEGGKTILGGSDAAVRSAGDYRINLFGGGPPPGRPRRGRPDGPAGGPGFAPREPGPGPERGGPGPAPIRLLAGPAWELVITHRAGSLDAAVSDLRYRNLAISLGILAVLGAAAVLVVASVNRARALTALQMEFVARVSHELKTPVAAIRSGAYNLARGIVSAPEDVSRYGQLIDDEGRRLGDMVDQIMLFTQMESGRISYNRRGVSIPEVVERALGTMRSAIEKSGSRVDLDLAADLKPVMADATALSHCVQNLISNAVKYGGGQPISIRAAQAKDSKTLELTVSDRGAGIPPEDLDHIFEPFYRGHNASPEIPGNGLGLNLVQRMMEGQGGRITVDTTQGGGSRFTLHIPMA